MAEELPTELIGHKALPSAEPRRRRRRTTRSCFQCRCRKIKCDRNKPCSNCVTSERQCTYVTPDGQIKDASIPIRHNPSANSDWTGGPSHPPSLLPRTKPAGAVSQSSETNGFSNGFSAAVTPAKPGISRGSGEPARIPPTGIALAASADTHKAVDSPAWSVDTTGHLSEHSSQLGIHDSRITINKARLLGSSTSWAMKHEFSEIFGCFMEVSGHGNGILYQSPEAKAIIAEAANLSDQCKSIGRRIKVARPTRGTTSLEPCRTLISPSRSMADTMLDQYFQHFESTHRILHIPTFRAEYERYWENPATPCNNLRFKVLLAIGIGSSVFDHGDRERDFRQMVQQWMYAAQFWLAGPLEKDRLNLSGIQVYCLLILARQIFNLGGDLVWTSMGTVVHSAVQIGLHRDPSRLPPMSVLQAEVRRRLWATIIELSLQAALDSGMPCRISFDEYDTQPPANINDDELEDVTGTAAPFQSHPKEVYTSTSVQLLLLDSQRLRFRVLQLLNGLSTEVSYNEVLALSNGLVDACRTYTHFANSAETGTEAADGISNEATPPYPAGITPFHRNMLDYLVRRFLLPLHCSFASQARTNPLFYYSRRVSLDATLAIMSPEPDPGFRRLMVSGGGLFREVFRFAGVAIGNELIAQAEAQQQDLTLHRSSEYRTLLKQTMRRLIDLSVERIRHGETNIKTYVYLNMVIAQAEAIETGAPSQIKIAESARESFGYCRELLEEQAGSAVSSPWTGGANGANGTSSANGGNADDSTIDMGNFDTLQNGFSAWDFDFGTFSQDAWYI